MSPFLEPIPLFVLVVSQILGAIGGFCQCHRAFSAANYLDVPAEDKFQDHFHQSVRRALSDVFAERQDFASISRAIAELAYEDPSTDLEARQVYDHLLMEPSEPAQCSQLLARIYLSALAQSSSSTDGALANLYEFLQWSCRTKLAHCAEMLNDEFERRAKQPPVAPDFQELFEETFHVDQLDLVGLHEKLSTFDLTRDSFDAKRLVRAASEIERAGREHGQLAARPIDDELAMLDLFMRDRCDRLYQSAARHLDLMGLARVAGLRPARFDVRLLLLTEYRRVCLTWRRPKELQMARANLRAQLRSNHIWNKLFKRFI